MCAHTCVRGCLVVFDTFVILCTGACQAPLSMELSRQRILKWVTISYARGSF